MTKTATRLAGEVPHNDIGEPFRTDAAVYRLDPPLLLPNGIADHLVASTLEATVLTEQGFRQAVETTLFVSDEEGLVVDWGAFPGSRHNTDHAEALAALGYTIVAEIGADA